MQSIVDKNKLHGFIGQRSCLPDQSVLLTHVALNCDFHNSLDNQFNKNRSVSVQLKYKLNHIPEDFLDRDIAKRALLEVIDRIESSRENSIYDKLCDTIVKEMNHSIPRYNATRWTSKRNKNAKPYWNDALNTEMERLAISRE